MKKLIFICLLITCVENLFAQDGLLDTTFGINGIVITDILSNDDFTYSVISQNEDKILVLGESSNSNSDNFCILRYNSDGTLDQTFGNNGKIISDITNSGYLFDIKIQNDGKIVGIYNNNGNNVVFRFNIDGSPDLSFADQGKIIINFPEYEINAITLTIQNDDKIIVAGNAQIVIGFTVSAIMRYNNDGSVDNSFGNSGLVINNIGGSITLVKIQSDSKILTIGNFLGSSYALSRYDSNGILDLGFGINGIINGIANSDTFMSDLLIQDDSKILLGGVSRNQTEFYKTTLVRYDTNGNIDNSFGNGGIAIIENNQNEVRSSSLLLQNDGKIIIGGSILSNTNFNFLLTRLNTNGTRDNSFGVNGITTTYINSNNSWISDIAFMPDGKIIAAGINANSSSYDIVLTKYTNNNLGINNFNTNFEITTASPNPTNDFITINYNLKTNSEISLELYDINGKVIMKPFYKVSREQGQNSEIINLNGLAKGTYFLALKSAEKNHLLKILKM
jgi:uncharacterized delta-60 repeat protein